MIDRQTPMTPTQHIHTMGVMGHMIVINSGFLPGTTILFTLLSMLRKLNKIFEIKVDIYCK